MAAATANAACASYKYTLRVHDKIRVLKIHEYFQCVGAKGVFAAFLIYLGV